MNKQPRSLPSPVTEAFPTPTSAHLWIWRFIDFFVYLNLNLNLNLDLNLNLNLDLDLDLFPFPGFHRIDPTVDLHFQDSPHGFSEDASAHF